MTPIQWIRAQPIALRRASNVWSTLLKYFSIIGDWVVWKIGNGKQVHIGDVSWAKSNNNWRLSNGLIQALKFKSISTLNEAV